MVIRPAYPEIYESDNELYEYVRNYQADQFIQHDRPEHLDMRRVMHGYFTPKSMEEWRPFVQSTIKELLDAARVGDRNVEYPAIVDDRNEDELQLIASWMELDLAVAQLETLVRDWRSLVVDEREFETGLNKLLGEIREAKPA